MTAEPTAARALEPIGRTLLFSPAARALPTGIEWLRPPTDDELHADDFLVQRCGESVGWWTGDIVVTLHTRFGADQTLEQYSTEYARTRSLNEQTVLKYAQVCSFYPVLKRLSKPVTWSHHYIVWGSSAAPSLAACMAWLERASRESWSTGKLREELSKKTRNEVDSAEPPAPSGDYEQLVKLELWSAQSLPRLAAIDAPGARDMLAHLSSTVTLIDGLRAKASQ